MDVRDQSRIDKKEHKKENKREKRVKEVKTSTRRVAKSPSMEDRKKTNGRGPAIQMSHGRRHILKVQTASYRKSYKAGRGWMPTVGESVGHGELAEDVSCTPSRFIC